MPSKHAASTSTKAQLNRLAKGRQKQREIRAKRKAHTVLHVQPGCLFYDITVEPIGSKAARAQDGGLRIDDLEAISPQWHGCDMIGHTPDGRRIAFHTQMTREHLYDK